MKHTSRTAWLMVLAFAVLIIGVSSIPAASMPRSESLWRMDKLIHASEYALLATLVYRALRRSSSWSPVTLLVVAALGCALFGAGDELYQGTVSGRDSSMLDALADLGGATFASMLAAVFYSRQRSIGGHHSQL